MKCELERGQRICPYYNGRHIGHCQEDVDQWRIREIVRDWCPYQGGEGIDGCGVGGLAIDFGMCCLIPSSKR